MAGRYDDALLEELRIRVPLEEVVSEYVPLKQKGRRFWGCCPFHHEKTPSFSVDTQSQMYYCFGCHKGGTVFQFVMEMEGLSFYESVKLLAERAHMQLPEPSGRPVNTTAPAERDRIYEANTLTAKFFHALLWKPEGAEALNYLYKRGLNDGDIRRFGLGASPKGWRTLYDYLTEQGFEPAILEKAGLIVRKENSTYDMFRDRVIFPIIDQNQKVVGFGGRIMGSGQPKYLNTAETPVFNKRRGLYCLNMAKKERDEGHLILVEGYMDTVSLRRTGVRGVVATLGTALTEEQVQLIKRYAPEVWISYDGDGAGQKAAMRALDMFDAQDVAAKVIDYPSGMDPDDYAKAYGKEGFDALPKLSATDYRFVRARDGLDMDTQAGVTQYAMNCCEIIKKLKDPIVAENYLRRLSQETGYDRSVLLRQIGSAIPDTMPERRTQKIRRIEPVKERVPLNERILLTILGNEMPGSDLIAIDDFGEGLGARLAQVLLEGRNTRTIMEAMEDPEEQRAAAEAFNYSPLPEDAEALKDMVANVLKEIRRERLNDRLKDIQNAIGSAKPEEKMKLYEQIQTISTQLSML